MSSNNAMSSGSPRLLAVLPVLCLSIALLSPRTAAQAPETAGKPAPQREYQALLAKMKKSDPTLDFDRLRWLRTQLDTYGPGSEDHPYEYFKTGNTIEAQALAENILAENELDLEANVTAAEIADQKKDAATAAYHRYVVQGLLDSVLRSGDGKSPETAYKVIAVSEEHAVLRHLGLQPRTQLLLEIGGRAYDLFRTVDAEGQPAREVYFDVDAIEKGVDRKLSR